MWSGRFKLEEVNAKSLRRRDAKRREMLKGGRLRTLSLAWVALTLFAVQPVSAHDFWVVPGKFVLSPGEKIRVFLNSGDEFPESESLVGEFRIRSFSLTSVTGAKHLTRFLTDGKSLTAEITAPEKGTAVLAAAVKPRLVRLKADEFNEYLEEDGLTRVLEERREMQEIDDAVVERYAKWAKAILKISDGEDVAADGEDVAADDTWKNPIGLKLEIVPEVNPHDIAPGDTLSVRVFFENEPISDLTIVGGRAGGPRHELRVVTDPEGRAEVLVPDSGRWYLRTIHMIRVEDDPQIQWESFWTTLTFEVSPR
jgi:uncharacterized GH25 family protein